MCLAIILLKYKFDKFVNKLNNIIKKGEFIMINSAKILRAVSILCTTLITIGILVFFYGYFGTDYSMLTGIGIGTTMGGVFIFIMGLFLVITGEVVDKNKEEHFPR
jgi:hypothetical protein